MMVRTFLTSFVRSAVSAIRTSSDPSTISLVDSTASIARSRRS
jgi:hypothetical protein